MLYFQASLDTIIAMTTTISPFRLGPEFTPATVRKLIIYTLCFSLGSAFLDPFFTQIFGVPGPQEWFSLSWWGFQHYLLWQPITYLFVHPIGYGGIGFSYFIGLIFNIYILWVIGSDICQRIDEKSFMRFYLICGILSGIATLFIMPLIGQYVLLAGPATSVMAVLLIWAFLNPEQELLLFFLFPVKAKWLSLGILGLALLISLSNLQFIYFFHYLLGALFGYMYGLTVWGVHSPFPHLYKPELAIIRASQKIRRLVPHKKGSSKSKVVNIKTGEPDDDEDFIDSMLEKISKYGENSLSFSERKRMEKISEKKSKH